MPLLRVNRHMATISSDQAAEDHETRGVTGCATVLVRPPRNLLPPNLLIRDNRPRKIRIRVPEIPLSHYQRLLFSGVDRTADPAGRSRSKRIGDCDDPRSGVLVYRHEYGRVVSLESDWYGRHNKTAIAPRVRSDGAAVRGPSR